MATLHANELEKDLQDILVEVSKIKHIENYDLILDLNANVGDGFISQFYTSEIKNKDTGEITNVAIKKPPLWEIEYATLFKNEELFYTTVFPALDSLQKSAGISEPFENIATFFCAGREPKKEFIALENVKPLSYNMFEKKNYLDKDHLEMIFRTYGKFHALSFVLKKQNQEKYQEINAEIVDIYETIADTLLPSLKSSLSAAVEALDPTSTVYQKVKDLPENYIENYHIAAKYTGSYRCITHGDCWSNNMLFKYSEHGKPDDIILIDFQLTRDGTPIHDLSYFFYSGASKTEMENVEDYLKTYHNSLSKCIKQFGEDPDELFPFDVLLKEWKENALLGILMGIYIWQVKLIPKQEMAVIMADKESSDEERIKMFEVMMHKLYTSDEYKERTSALLMHAFNYGVIGNRLVKKKEEQIQTIQ